MTSEAKTLECSHCGSSVRLEELAPSVTCSSCGNVVAVPEGIRRSLDGHTKDIRAALKTLRSDRSIVAAPRMDTAHAGRTFRYILVMSLAPVASTFLVLGVVSRMRGNTEIVAFVPFGILSIIVGASMCSGRWHRHAVEPLVTLDLAVVTCSSCGAVQAFTTAGVTSVCRSCNVALLPTDAVVASAPSVVAGMVYRERRERWRAAREGRASVSRGAHSTVSKGSLIVAVMIAAVLVLVPVLVLVIVGARSATLETFALLLFGVALALAIGYVISRHQRLSKAWNFAVGTLVASYGAIPAVATSWLDERWAGPSTDDVLYGGWAYHALGFHVAGYDELLVANVAPFKGQRAGIIVFLAAWIPGISEPDPASDASSCLSTPEARERHRDLASWGFRVQIVPAGIIAFANSDRIDHVASHPESVVELAAVVDEVARLARAIGARPVSEVLTW